VRSGPHGALAPQIAYRARKAETGIAAVRGSN
jgi:hypothetical protein